MSPRLRKVAVGILGVAVLAATVNAGLSAVLRHRPAALMGPIRVFTSRVLNPPVIWWAGRFGGASQPLVYHRGRRSGREYVTPLCVVPTPEGFIAPAAFGPDVDWLANLRVTPESRLVFEGKGYETVAEVIGIDEAIVLSGGTPGCPCWTQFQVEELVLLRPIARTEHATSRLG